jgi:hypothetical protein
MSRGRHTFRRTELTRAIKAVMAAGAEAEIDPITGKIVVVISKSGASVAEDPNEWDGAE